MHTTVEGKRQAERRTCLCHEEALPLEKQPAVQKQRPIAEARNVKFSKPPRAERNFLLTFFSLKKSMRAARAIVKTHLIAINVFPFVVFIFLLSIYTYIVLWPAPPIRLYRGTETIVAIESVELYIGRQHE